MILTPKQIDHFTKKLIVFEGYENTGKSSVAELLADTLSQNNISTILTRQPGGDWGPLATTLRSLCKDKRWNLSDYGNLFAFLLDRAECVDKIIRPALQEGKTVICDRYTYSTVAYQLFGKKLIDDLTKTQGQRVAIDLLNWFKNPYKDVIPNIIYYFPEKVGNRKDNEHDLFDNETVLFETRVKNAYNEMSTTFYREDQEPWKIVKPGSSVEITLTNLLELE